MFKWTLLKSISLSLFSYLEAKNHIFHPKKKRKKKKEEANNHIWCYSPHVGEYTLMWTCPNWSLSPIFLGLKVSQKNHLNLLHYLKGLQGIPFFIFLIHMHLHYCLLDQVLSSHLSTPKNAWSTHCNIGLPFILYISVRVLS